MISLSVSGEKLLPAGFDAKTIIRRVLSLKKISSGHFDFNFVSAKKILAVNKTFLSHHYQTDIITFNLGSQDDLVGDVYICVAEAQKNANDYGNSLDDELKLLIIHGILHLLNYRDHTASESQKMEREQTRILRELNRRK